MGIARAFSLCPEPLGSQLPSDMISNFSKLRASLVGLISLVIALAVQGQVEVTSGGNVGIGTSAPNFPLDIATGPAEYAFPALNILPSAHGTSERATIGFGFTQGSIPDGWILGQDYFANNTRSFYLLHRNAGVSAVRWFVDSYGSMGIGTTAPVTRLEVSGAGVRLGTTSAYFNFISTQDHTAYKGVFLGYDSSGQIGIVGSGSSGGPSSLAWWITNSAGTYTEAVRIDPAGNVGIGIAAPTQKLEVGGSIRAVSFISNSTTYADFVFRSDYVLPSLSDVEDHIKENGHLPGIPSEAEVREQGIDLAAMQVKLLQKIEELTLHAIEQDKRLNAQEREILVLRTQLSNRTTIN